MLFQQVSPAHPAAPKPNELFVGVGLSSHLGPEAAQILSRKHVRWQGLRSTLETIIRSGSALDELSAKWVAEPGAFFSTPVTLVVPAATLDTVFAALVLVHRLLWREWPGELAALQTYVADWEEGRVAQAGRYRRGLAPVFYATQRLLERAAVARARSCSDSPAGCSRSVRRGRTSRRCRSPRFPKAPTWCCAPTRITTARS